MPRRHPTRSVLAALVASAVAMGCATEDDGDVADQRRDAAFDAAIDAGLDEAVAEFLGLAALGSTATYRVTLVGLEEADEVVIASRPPDLRIDVLVDGRTIAAQTVVDGLAETCLPTATVDGDDGGPADGKLSCTESDAAPTMPAVFEERAMAELTESLARHRDDYDFAVQDQVIADAEARCLITTIQPGRERPELGETGTMCVSPNGVLLRLERADSVVEATSYAVDVSDEAFVVDGT